MSSAIVLGGASDELVAAHVLARAGWQVTVIEPFDVPDRLRGWFPPTLAAALGMQLTVQRPDPWITVPLDGATLALSRDIERTREAIARFSPRDAERWPKY